MPKENINDATTPGFRTEITWSRAGHVQMATVNPDSPLRLDDEPFDGWHVTLDRDGCNRAIRALRRARDQAYGRDE